MDPHKNYSIWLHLAEIDPRISSEGQRIFDILINGDIALKNVNIIHSTGEHNTALVLNRTIVVSGKTLNVTLRPSRGSHAIIAIEVFEVIAAELRTSSEEVKTLLVLKNSLGLPLRLGWNGDPCVPRQHPWSGVDCQFDRVSGKWNIDGLGLESLDNQGLRGLLPEDISKLHHLQSINLSGNSIQGQIPHSLGTISGLQELNLNGNSSSGRVPAALGGRPLHGASFKQVKILRELTSLVETHGEETSELRQQAYVAARGLETRGRVRGYGRGVTPEMIPCVAQTQPTSSSFRSRTERAYANLQSQYSEIEEKYERQQKELDELKQMITSGNAHPHQQSSS
ncbi:probable LRR receptor-like serine/threonine-protein kinase At1g51820 [Asparagus officinalis]|uniref:probable LRR receptor-like serine/threonine-protein kinase At1g51820 n=1 Tax=Asparagus officinalis TaxID=4686 RepID=UPI00098DF312|nr:probable LRR receptor-like serine/threonine-protein kinase At1g51820 [Asparagus officinalis]